MSTNAEIGRMIADRYRLERVLGRGGMATVYLAVDTKLDRTVAVKVLHSDLARQPSFRIRFRQEAQAAARMTSPAVVRVFDAGDAPEADGDGVTPYLVMEYVEGKLLSERIAAGPLPQDEALRIITQVLNALEYSHQAGIVHRDVKPSNIMLSTDGEVKVMDFGIAHAVTDVTDSAAQTTNILGTAAYFSPEQARGEAVDARSDLYSAGVVLFEMLTGKPPFTDPSPVRVAYKHLSETAPAPSSLNPNVSPAVDVVVARALAKSKIDRYNSAEDFRADVELAARGIVPVEYEAPATELLLGDLDTLSLTPSELALRQLSESASEARAAKRPPVMWIWAGGVLIFGLVVAVLFWAFALAPSAELASTQRVIPDLSNQSQQDAIAALTKLGLTDLVLQVNDATTASGNVVRTDPAAGESVSEGTQVTLYISKGANTKSLPDVKNQTTDQASQTLTAAGFVVGSTNKVNSPTITAGTVVSTDPAAGTAAAAGSTVNLNVSNGKVTLPSVVGKPLADASTLLRGADLGLTVTPVGDSTCKTVANNPVTAQSIPPGDVDQRSTIKLTFCSG